MASSCFDHGRRRSPIACTERAVGSMGRTRLPTSVPSATSGRTAGPGPAVTIGDLCERHRRIAFDSNVIVYLLEAVEPWALAARQLLNMIDAGRAGGVLSVIGVAELCAGPAGHGDLALVERYAEALGSMPGIRIQPVTAEVAVEAAVIRGLRGSAWRMPCTSRARRAAGATAFVTNDRRLRGSTPARGGLPRRARRRLSGRPQPPHGDSADRETHLDAEHGRDAEVDRPDRAGAGEGQERGKERGRGDEAAAAGGGGERRVLPGPTTGHGDGRPGCSAWRASTAADWNGRGLTSVRQPPCALKMTFDRGREAVCPSARRPTAPCATWRSWSSPAWASWGSWPSCPRQPPAGWGCLQPRS